MTIPLTPASGTLVSCLDAVVSLDVAIPYSHFVLFNVLLSLFRHISRIEQFDFDLGNLESLV